MLVGDTRVEEIDVRDIEVEIKYVEKIGLR